MGGGGWFREYGGGDDKVSWLTLMRGVVGGGLETLHWEAKG